MLARRFDGRVNHRTQRRPLYLVIIMTSPLPSDVSVHEVKQLLDSEQPFLLLDCRGQDEYDLVHLEPAKLIPMDELQHRVSELHCHRTSRIVVYCHLGGRSQMVTAWLRQQGFTQVQNMAGGIDAWAQQIDPSLPRY